jgi:uncharacterized protein
MEPMNARTELRADGLHILGYVNVPGRWSRPVLTAKYGKVIEVIEQGAFQKAIDAAKDGIKMLLDHNRDRVLADTTDGTLKLYEDEIGLKAEAVVTDEAVIEGARNEKLKGWSFNMMNVEDQLEVVGDGELPRRHVKSFDMDEITLVMNKMPIYSATSVEVRADSVTEVEERATISTFEMEKPAKKPDNPLDEYRNRLNSLKR